jgi:hypothetical protein
MKYIVTIPVSAALVGVAVVSSGYSLDAASVFSILFVSCLPAWVLWDYDGTAQSRKTPRRAPAAQPERQAEPADAGCVPSTLVTAFGK